MSSRNGGGGSKKSKGGSKHSQNVDVFGEEELMEDDDLELLEENGIPEDGGEEGDEGEDGEMADEEVNEEEEEAPAITDPLGPDMSVRAFRGHGDSIYGVDVSGDGVWALSGSGDDTAMVWRVADCTGVATLPTGSETVSCVAFNTSGTLAATGCYDKLVRVYSMAAVVGGEVGGGGGGGGGGGAAGAGAGAGTAASPAPDGPPPLHTLEGPTGDINFLVWHPKGDVVLAGSGDCTVWMWSCMGKEAAFMQVLSGHGGSVGAGVFAKEGKVIVTGGDDGEVRVWAPKSGKCTKTWECGEAPVTSLAVSPMDESLVCATLQDGTLRVFNLESQREVFRANHNEPTDSAAVVGEEDVESTSVEAAAFCGVQPWLASGSTNGVLIISDMGTGVIRHKMNVGGGIIKLAWIPTTSFLVASTAHGLVKVLDARDGSTKADFTGHAGMVLDFKVSGRTIVTGGDDGVARVFDTSGF